MSWAIHAKEALGRGESVQVRPRGHSMTGKVDDGDCVTLEPVDPTTLVVGHDYLHLIKAIRGTKFLIGNNRGGTNGWVGPQAIFGIATAIE
jgi:hypothetical protein